MLLNVNYKMTRFQFDLVNYCPKRGLMLSTRHNSSYSLSMVSSEINSNYLRIHANANDKVSAKLFRAKFNHPEVQLGQNSVL